MDNFAPFIRKVYEEGAKREEARPKVKIEISFETDRLTEPLCTKGLQSFPRVTGLSAD